MSSFSRKQKQKDAPSFSLPLHFRPSVCHPRRRILIFKWSDQLLLLSSSSSSADASRRGNDCLEKLKFEGQNSAKKSFNRFTTNQRKSIVGRFFLGILSLEFTASLGTFAGTGGRREQPADLSRRFQFCKWALISVIVLLPLLLLLFFSDFFWRDSFSADADDRG